MFDRDVPVDGRLPVRDGRECGDGALLQLPEPHQDEAALQPDGRTSRPADENQLLWGRGGPVCEGNPPNCFVNCSVYCSLGLLCFTLYCA